MDKNTIKSIVEFAIDTELDSYNFYKDAISKVDDLEAKLVFGALAEEELNHKKYLEKILKDEDLKFELEETTNYMVSEEVGVIDDYNDIDLIKSIEIAMKKEEEAMYMYRALANDSLNSDIKDIFINLSNMEKIHKSKLERIYIDIKK